MIKRLANWLMKILGIERCEHKWVQRSQIITMHGTERVFICDKCLRFKFEPYGWRPLK
jgi:hypothetical protein